MDVSSDLMTSIRGRHEQVLERIHAAAHQVGRTADSVRLVVVSKSQPLAVVEAAILAGVRILGENYAEEAAAKISAVQAMAGMSASVEWHMIGHIQSRKAKLVAPHFALIHSIDSVKIAERLDGLAAEIGRELCVLLEFNIGGEMGKHGWAASNEVMWPHLVDEIGPVCNLSHLKVQGLMTMPPLSSEAEEARPYFRRLRELQDYLGKKLPGTGWDELSMGTSIDYAVAVEEGATLVRVGEAILGSRPAREKI